MSADGQLRPRVPAGARRSPRAIEQLLAAGLASMSSAVSLIEVHSGRLVFVNPAFERLTGHPAAEAVGSPWTLVEGPETDPETARTLRAAIREERELRVRVRHHRRDGRPYWSETFLSPVRDGDRPVTHYMCVQKDVTAQTEAQERAVHLAFHDSLTGLPNRAQFLDHLGLGLARARRHETALAVLFLDLDGFKLANDTHGHDAGDQLLAAVTQRWLGVARGGDVLARYGGDEFLLLVTDMEPAEARAAVADTAARYAAAMDRPFTVAARPGTEIEIGVSVGVAVYPFDGRTIEELLATADAAMYEIKRRRRAAAA